MRVPTFSVWFFFFFFWLMTLILSRLYFEVFLPIQIRLGGKRRNNNGENYLVFFYFWFGVLHISFVTVNLHW